MNLSIVGNDRPGQQEQQQWTSLQTAAAAQPARQMHRQADRHSDIVRNVARHSRTDRDIHQTDKTDGYVTSTILRYRLTDVKNIPENSQAHRCKQTCRLTSKRTNNLIDVHPIGQRRTGRQRHKRLGVTQTRTMRQCTVRMMRQGLWVDDDDDSAVGVRLCRNRKEFYWKEGRHRCGTQMSYVR